MEEGGKRARRYSVFRIANCVSDSEDRCLPEGGAGQRDEASGGEERRQGRDIANGSPLPSYRLIVRSYLGWIKRSNGVRGWGARLCSPTHKLRRHFELRGCNRVHEFSFFPFFFSFEIRYRIVTHLKFENFLERMIIIVNIKCNRGFCRI